MNFADKETKTLKRPAKLPKATQVAGMEFLPLLSSNPWKDGSTLRTN